MGYPKYAKKLAAVTGCLENPFISDGKTQNTTHLYKISYHTEAIQKFKPNRSSRSKMVIRHCIASDYGYPLSTLNSQTHFKIGVAPLQIEIVNL